MKITVDYPPNFEQIDRAFGPLGHKSILYAYGDTIYNPMDVVIAPQLIAHEEMHGIQQMQHESAESWWDLYLSNKAFRLYEETLAHRAEYQHMVSNAPNRFGRRMALKHVAQRLAAPLYGRIITTANAKKELVK